METQSTGAAQAAAGSFTALTSKAPHWAALLAVVGLFLFYMDRSSTQADRVADQRIEVCHRVQADSIASMDRLNATMVQWQLSNQEMLLEMQELRMQIRGSSL